MPATETQRIYTYRDYLEWGEDVRRELIDGRVYDMTPAPSRTHQRISMELSVQIRNHLGRETPCEVYAAPFDVRIPDTDDRGCRGAPDWIIEITSPSTASKDYIEKLALYEKHGVREYWIVHPVDQIVMVYRIAEEGRYGRAGIYSSEDRVETEVIEGLVIDLGEVFRS